MISDFETRLAETLGTLIGAPFTGRVDVAPGPDPDDDVRLILGVVNAEVVDEGMGSRPEVLPGDPNPRRAVRLRCNVAIETRVAPADREEQMKALEAALYALDDAEFRTGKALTDGTDRGFVIHELRPATVVAPLAPAAPNDRVGINVIATGLFWPVGVAGQAGDLIDEIRLRAGIVPMEIVPADPRLVAGGPAVELTIRFDTKAFSIKEGKTEKMPFGSVAVTLVAPEGKPGKGALAGGVEGQPATVRIVPVDDNAATITYTPPATPATEDLVVAFDDAAQGLGVEIGRVRLVTRSA
ncbi:MAG TPA: hypothetical protein VNI54_01605 [Thermoanaerobaculia bacterium]|nr:hypothetical protein [Thermoanaerobaculia bacterium]